MSASGFSQPSFCSNCGTPMDGRFCANCGHDSGVASTYSAQSTQASSAPQGNAQGPPFNTGSVPQHSPSNPYNPKASSYSPVAPTKPTVGEVLSSLVFSVNGCLSILFFLFVTWLINALFPPLGIVLGLIGVVGVVAIIEKARR